MLRMRWRGRLQSRGGRGGSGASRGGDPAVPRPSARRGVCMPSLVVRRVLGSVMDMYRVVGPRRRGVLCRFCYKIVKCTRRT